MEKEVGVSLKKNPNGSYGIFVQYCKEGVYLKSTGIILRLNASQLDFIKRKNKIPSNIGNYEILNDKLQEVKEGLKCLIETYVQSYNEYPTKAQIESYQKYVPSKIQNKSDDLIECLSKFIELKEKSKNVKQYKTLLHHLEKFSTWKVTTKKTIKLTDLQLEFFKGFFIFLSQKDKILKQGTLNVRKGLCDNALVKLSYELAAAIRGIKKYKIADLNESDIISNIQLAIEELHVKPYRNFEVVLSHQEVEVLLNFKLQDAFITDSEKSSERNKRVTSIVLERVKYLFILQIYKATRHSDLHQICLENLNGNRISIKQQKTQHQYEVSIDDTAIELMKKSNSETRITNQRYNTYLKLIFKQFFPFYKENYRKDDLGYKLEQIPIIKNYLGVERKEYKKRYELVRTHTARRTYASVGHIRNGLTDTELQHDLGQTNKASVQTYKIYYEEAERPEVFNLKFEE